MAQNEGLLLKELIDFYNARDLFCGTGNCQTLHFNVERGYHLLSTSRHPEAVHLCAAFSSAPKTSQDVRNVLMTEEHRDDVVLMTYLACHALTENMCLRLCRRAIDAGSAFAFTILYERCMFGADHETSERLIVQAARGGDRIGLYRYYVWFCNSRDTETLVEAQRALVRSAHLEYYMAMEEYAVSTFNVNDPRYYWWYGRACNIGLSWSNTYLQHVEAQLHRTPPNVPVLLMIGKLFVGNFEHIAAGRRLPARVAVQRYQQCLARTRAACVEWILCSRRLGPQGICKDVARMIGLMVWETGKETFYTTPT